MPLLEESPRTEPAVRSRPSLAVELEWAMATSQRPDWIRDHPGLDRVFRGSPDLAGHVADLWPPELRLSCWGSPELLIMAQRAGVLFSTDAGELLGDLESLCRRPGGAPVMTSESQADRAVIDERLALLRRSARQRRQFVRVVKEVWSAVGPLWESEGRAAVDAAVAGRARRIESGRTWREVVGADLPADHHEELAQLAAGLGPGGELVVVPAYFTHIGLIIDLGAVLLVGVRVGPADPRAGTEALARRLKAVADPTRLAVLGLLAGGPRTVTELARRFDVAQPTMSNHVKLLRQAGLVTGRSRDGRKELSLSREAASGLLSDLQGLVTTS